jgi:hypothetical protein
MYASIFVLFTLRIALSIEDMKKPNDYSLILNCVMWSQVALALIFITLRMYTRRCLIQNLGWDDVLMAVNYVSLLAPLPPF